MKTLNLINLKKEKKPLSALAHHIAKSKQYRLLQIEVEFLFCCKMSDCTRCNTDIDGDEFFKCDGGCGKIYHIQCAVPGSGVTKPFYKLFLENEYFMFMCTNCRKSSLKAINEKMNKVISTIVINDERVTRYTDHINNLKQSLDELNKVSMKAMIDTVNELKDVVHKHTEDSSKKNDEKVNEEIVEIKKVLNLNKKEITENVRKIGMKNINHRWLHIHMLIV